MPTHGKTKYLRARSLDIPGPHANFLQECNCWVIVVFATAKGGPPREVQRWR
jgi:hypothetical protein